jgi:hypothetical protein
MATRSTGGIPRVGVESWDPGIKAPGVNKHTTYTKGEVAGIADYSKVNDAIQKSITDMAPGLAADLKANKEARSFTDEQKTFLEEQGIDEKYYLGRRDYMSGKLNEINPDTGVAYTRKEARAEWKTRNDLDPAQKALLAKNVADNTANQTDEEFTKAAEELVVTPFSKQNGRQKKETKRSLDKLIKAKESMNTMMTDWVSGGIDGYDKKMYNAFPQVDAFMQHMITFDGSESNGKKPYTFSNKDGGTILYGNGKSLKMNDLIAGQDIYKNAQESNEKIRTDYATDVKGISDRLIKVEGNIIKSMNEKGTVPVNADGSAYTYDRGAEIRRYLDAEFTTEDYEDIFYNVMTKSNKIGDGSDLVFLKYNSEIHDPIVEKYIMDEIEATMGTQAPFTKEVVDPSDPSEKEINYGGGSIGAGAYASATKIADRLIAISGIEVVPQGMNAETMPTLEGKIPQSDSTDDKEKKFFNELDLIWNTDPETGKKEGFFNTGDLTNDKLTEIVQYGINNSGNFDKFPKHGAHAEKVFERWSEVHKPEDILYIKGGKEMLDLFVGNDEETLKKKKAFEKAMQTELNNLLAFTDVGTAKNIKKVSVRKNKEGQTVLTLKFPSSTGSTQLVPKDYILDPDNPNGMKEIFGDLLKGAQLDAGQGVNADALLDFILRQKRK